MALTQEQLEQYRLKMFYGLLSADEIHALFAHLTTLEADRARMDWLENHGENLVSIANDYGPYEDMWKVFKGDSIEAEAATLRQAIDTAMQSPTQGEKKV